jgi:hypothetical protein
MILHITQGVSRDFLHCVLIKNFNQLDMYNHLFLNEDKNNVFCCKIIKTIMLKNKVSLVIFETVAETKQPS